MEQSILLKRQTNVRALRDGFLIFIGFVAMVILVGCWPTWQLYRSFDRIEEKLKARITPEEIRRWGTNVLEENRSGFASYEELPTNMPDSLLRVFKHPPYVVINESPTNENGQVKHRWLTVWWGSGLLGHCGLEIGSTNFLGARVGDEWAGGVYFWKDR